MREEEVTPVLKAMRKKRNRCGRDPRPHD
jgi:hypothetical protein